MAHGTRRHAALLTLTACAAAAALPASAHANRSYAAVAADRTTLATFELSDAGDRVRALTLRTELDCGDGTVRLFNGRFLIRTRPAPSLRNEEVLVPSAAAPGTLAGELRARWGGRRAYTVFSGRLTLRAIAPGSAEVGLRIGSRTVPSSDDRRRCRVSQTLSARREPGRLFAGFNSREEPVVLRAGTRRGEFLTGYDADCRPSGFMDGVGRAFLPLGGGVFGSSTLRSLWRIGGYSVRGRVAGRVAGARASGTARLLGRSDGERCDTGRVRWQATST